jgi:hypothetical protein
VIIDSSICVATTTGLPARRAGAGDLLLDAWHRLQRHLDAEVAARNHQRVGQFDDLGQPGDGLRLFDLGHDQRPAASDLARFRESSGRCTKDSATQSTLASTASRSLRSFSVRAPTGRSSYRAG